MSDVIVMGGGPVGLTSALLLAGDGHDVTVLEKDRAGFADPSDAWDRWARIGARQFRQPHVLLPGGWMLLQQELPDVVHELRLVGAEVVNHVAGAWRVPDVGGRRDGDERFEVLGARRPVLEAGLGAVAARTSSLTIHHGAAVARLVTEVGPPPRVTGVRTQGGDIFHADVVIDATGRNSPLPKLLSDIGVVPAIDERAPIGFTYYSRHFTGPRPPQWEWPIDHHASLSTVVLPGDNGTWSVAMTVAGNDKELCELRHPEVWQRVAALLPNIERFTRAEPLTGVLPMDGTESRRRGLVLDGRPVITGLINIGDAWATTSPQFGFGLSMGIEQAVTVRELLSTVGTDDPVEMAVRFEEMSENTSGDLHQRLVAWDRHRLAEMQAGRQGVPYETDDQDWHLMKAMDATKLLDGDVMRAVADVGSMLAMPEDVLVRPGIADKIKRLSADAPAFPAPGPTHAELLAAINA
ncbi:NAD(P)/FAD-dependent oxidoreductase [Streptomyces sp. NPDC098781]|uniref:NAD(P)/FAD-dependent oxidoreductase n=1 Tax=Streptomyces sp. NPDC098781 TaxID=3366097 RepID=UPI00382EBFE8